MPWLTIRASIRVASWGVTSSLPSVGRFHLQVIPLVFRLPTEIHVRRASFPRSDQAVRADSFLLEAHASVWSSVTQ